jgi:hypothetical protein
MSTLHVENLKGLSSGGNANKIIVPSGQTLHATGHVIQTVSTNLGADHSYSSSSTAETNILTLNITPKFNTSKVLVLCNLGLYLNSSAAVSRGDLGIRRDSTLVRGRDDAGGEGFFRDSSGHFKSYMTVFNFLDSPATTSAITYKAFHKGNDYNAGGHFSQHYTSMSLMEIAQ